MSITESEPPGCPDPAWVSIRMICARPSRAMDSSFARSGFAISPSPSMKPAIASTCTPLTAIAGAYTTSSAAHSGVPRASLVVPTTAPSSRVTLSLIRIVFAFSGPAIRPSRMIKESPTTVQVKSPARNPLIGYVYQMRPT